MPAGLGGELLAGGPADFLLIFSRKPAPVRACERLWGVGSPLCASCPRGAEGSGGGAPWRRGPAGTQASWAGASPALGAGTELRRCGASPASCSCGLGPLGREVSGEGPGTPAFPQRLCGQT